MTFYLLWRESDACTECGSLNQVTFNSAKEAKEWAQEFLDVTELKTAEIVKLVSARQEFTFWEDECGN